MSGILNNKERILDFILTKEGRRQLAEDGSIQAEFAVFSDGGTFYQADAISGSADAGSRIYFEATSLPQDQISFEADDSGKLLPYPGSNIVVKSGKVISGTISGSSQLRFITGSEFASLSEKLLISSIDNFKNLLSIGSTDFFRDDDEFSLSQTTANFNLTNNSPIKKDGIKKINLNNIDTFFQDKKLSRIPNFKHLPPINKKTSQNPFGSPLGNYPKLGQGDILNFNQIKDELRGKEEIIIEFAETSLENNLMSQFFEQQENELLKLDVLHFGEFIDENDEFPTKNIYFIGKVFVNDFGAKSFVKLFTLIFEWKNGVIKQRIRQKFNISW